MLGTNQPPKRKVTMFEVILLILGIIVLVVGFVLIRNTFITTGGTLSWFMIGAIFSWLTLLILFVVSELNADVKEELSIVMREHVDQTMMLKEINQSLLDEIKEMRKDMNKKGRKKS
ncbi:MAG: hypothetical protein ACMXYL_04490 [Candidatus Woesearchaeota archaeon]